MATKKQKRLKLEARRAKREADLVEEGLRAQQRDREMRAARREQAQWEAERVNRRHETILATAKLRGEL